MTKALAPHFALLLILAACSNTISATVTGVPTSLPSAIPPTEIPPTASVEPIHTPTSISQIKTFPYTICCDGKPMEPGEYELPSWLGIPLTMEVNEGWRVLNEQGARLFMLGKGQSVFNDPTQVFVFITVPDGHPQTILASIKTEMGLTAQGEISETTIAGFSGLQLDFSAKPNPEYEGEIGKEIPPGVQFLPVVNKYFTTGFLWTTWTAESRLRFIALNVGSDVLLLEIESPPSEFETFASEADQVLQTLKLRR